MSQAPPQRQTFRFSLPNTGIAPRFAREWVVHLLYLTGHSKVAGPAKLLTSEVVTNVYVHTDTLVVHIDLTVSPRRVRVAVWDTAPEVRLGLDRTPEGVNHRGLLIVEELSSQWGVNWPAGNRLRQKRVWFALNNTAEEGAAA